MCPENLIVMLFSLLLEVDTLPHGLAAVAVGEIGDGRGKALAAELQPLLAVGLAQLLSDVMCWEGELQLLTEDNGPLLRIPETKDRKNVSIRKKI